MDQNESLSEAIALIKGASPQVCTFMQECAKASIWLMAERYPLHFSVDLTISFLNSPSAD